MTVQPALPFFRIPQPSQWKAAKAVTLPRFDGLTAFTPFFSIAALFSIAGDPQGLIGHQGLLYMALSWAIVFCSGGLFLAPRKTLVLLGLAASTVLLYMMRLPVASNNKTITVVFCISLLLSSAVLLKKHRELGTAFREELYWHLKLAARLILLIMYFYGIFHKINSGFMDPTVSCAVGLYKPLATPFGLEDNLAGRYLAIASTFIVEGIAIVSLLWPRWFAVGLILSLPFHYIIPISAYSWYMDFSSLVFALYVLTIPREVAADLYAGTQRYAVQPLREWFGRVGVLVPFLLIGLAAAAMILLLSFAHPGRPALMLLHSMFILIWAVLGGVAMIAMIWAALGHMPYKGQKRTRQPAWLYVVPGLFFLSCLSPYLGLKTESSINMFSNLHTEGGYTNHYLFRQPPYVGSYQRQVVHVVDSSNATLRGWGDQGLWNVKFSVEEQIRRHPNQWVKYEDRSGNLRTMTAASLGPEPSFLERKLLIFKPVDYSRPKICTH